MLILKLYKGLGVMSEENTLSFVFMVIHRHYIYSKNTDLSRKNSGLVLFNSERLQECSRRTSRLEFYVLAGGLRLKVTKQKSISYLFTQFI